MKKTSRAVAIFITISALESVAANLAHPITPTLMTTLQMPSFMFGLAFACMAFTNFLFSPFWGKISEYFNSRKILALCCFGYGIGQFMFGYATTKTAIVIARLVSGAFAGGINVYTLIHMIDISPLEKRSSNITLCATLVTAGSAVGYLIGGLIGDHTLKGTFFFQVLVLFGCGILYYFLLDDTKTRDNTVRKSAVPWGEVVKQANPFRSFTNMKEVMSIVFFVIMMITLFTSTASTAYEKNFDYFIKQQLNFPPSYNGIIKATVGTISLISNLTACMWIVRTRDVKKYFVGVMAFCTTLMIGVIAMNSMVPFIAVNIGFFAMNSIYIPLLQNIVSTSVESEKTGIAMGSYNALKSLGMIFGSLLAGYIYDIWPKLAFVLAAVMFLLAMLLSMFVYKYKRQAKA